MARTPIPARNVQTISLSAAAVCPANSFVLENCVSMRTLASACASLMLLPALVISVPLIHHASKSQKSTSPSRQFRLTANRTTETSLIHNSPVRTPTTRASVVLVWNVIARRKRSSTPPCRCVTMLRWCPPALECLGQPSTLPTAHNRSLATTHCHNRSPATTHCHNRSRRLRQLHLSTSSHRCSNFIVCIFVFYSLL